MKAQVLNGIDNLCYEDVDVPQLNEGQVLIKVKACGICGSDIPRIFQNGTYHFPTIPGHEFSGQVVEVGPLVDEAWLNKRVGVFPLIPCKTCDSCKNKLYQMCSNYSYLGSRTDGGFAEYVAVPVWNLVELPTSVSYEQAAMLEPLSVASHAMRKVDPKKNDFILVHGLGTIGLLLVMLLKSERFEKLLVIGNKKEQKEKVIALGIKEENYIDSVGDNVEKKISELTQGKGVDVYFECVGKNEIVESAVINTSAAGKIQLVGNPASDMELSKDVYWKILRKELTIKGSWNSSFTRDQEDDWYFVLNKINSGAIHPEDLISHRFSLENLGDGLDIMKNKTCDYTKIMIVS